MIPPELTPFLCRYLDTPALVALYQTSRSWRHVISERDFKQVLQHDRPWIQLENSDFCCWKKCALVAGGLEKPRDHSRSLALFKRSFQHYSFPVKQDVPLPDDFYTLCKQPLFETQTTFDDSGFVHVGADGQRVFVSLSESHSVQDTPSITVSGNRVTSQYGISMCVTGDLEMAIHSCTPEILVTAIVVMDEPLGDKLVDGMYLYIKYKDGFSEEPDGVIFAEFPQGYTSEPTLYTVGACVFVQSEVDGQIHTQVVRHGELELLDVSKSKNVGLVCYNGSYWIVDSCCWSEKDSSCSPVCQDPLYPQYAVFYDNYGFRSHVVDLKNRLTMNLREVTKGESVAVVGLSRGKLEVYTYSKAFLETKMERQEYLDFVRTLNNTPATCGKRITGV
ncbi:hypothetical protein CJU90_4412 [Yarrowia sp. C11]|nr:hypothetical protein CKK34_6694 [Yarrowia sp. E02]KAG5365337.1 hypothetical protein CJU90_4412 [Yarrowia sp. C11]